MKIKLISYTPNMLDVVYTSARTCYNTGSPIDMWENVNDISNEKKKKLINKVFKSGHLSTSEHIYFTFAIEGISRSCSHQLVRHRFCSFSQQSQRYCEFKEGKFEYVTPDKIKNNSQALEIFENTMNKISQSYNELSKIGLPAEDCRAVLPNACTTNLTLTLNLRELIHICSLRLCTRSQLEIRQMAKQIRDLVVEKEPWLDDYLQPKCIQDGFCDEDKSCGRKPTLQVLLGQEYNKGYEDACYDGI